MNAMFDIGFGEMILLAAIALIAIGPKQLPEVARAVGKLLGEVKKTVGEVTSTVANAREETDRAIRKVTSDLTDITSDINDSVANSVNTIHQQPDARPRQKDPVPTPEPNPIIPVVDHAGDPPWIVNPDLPRPQEAGVAENTAEYSATHDAAPTDLPFDSAKVEAKKPSGEST